METKNKELATRQGYLMESAADLAEENMQGIELHYPVVKVPSGGAVSFELPGDDPDNPESVREIEGVILYHHPLRVYYEDSYDGSNTPPACVSTDDQIGTDADGVAHSCPSCRFSQFGSGADGSGQACKKRRNIYLLSEGECFPKLLSVPTGSLRSFEDYLLRLMSRGKRSGSVVTRFSLRKAENRSGIKYSQVVFTWVRDLEPAETESLRPIAEQTKAHAQSPRRGAADLDGVFDD